MEIMEKYGFYKADWKTIYSMEMHRQNQFNIKLPWCSHPKHSPAKLDKVKRGLGGGNVLRCGGSLDCCQIPEEKFTDVTP
jgi:hypothetical protein